jgi:hypothetical protein
MTRATRGAARPHGELLDAPASCQLHRSTRDHRRWNSKAPAAGHITPGPRPSHPERRGFARFTPRRNARPRRLRLQNRREQTARPPASRSGGDT